MIASREGAVAVAAAVARRRGGDGPAVAVALVVAIGARHRAERGLDTDTEAAMTGTDSEDISIQERRPLRHRRGGRILDPEPEEDLEKEGGVSSSCLSPPLLYVLGQPSVSHTRLYVPRSFIARMVSNSSRRKGLGIK
jgi:hypothetical protein